MMRIIILGPNGLSSPTLSPSAAVPHCHKQTHTFTPAVKTMIFDNIIA